jgi:hypothetical protein
MTSGLGLSPRELRGAAKIQQIMVRPRRMRVIDPRPQFAPSHKPSAVHMAKGQKKSNKEVRKPKQEKPKPQPAGRSFLDPSGAKGR